MSYFAITDAELDLGIDYAFKKFGCMIMRTNLRKVGDRVLTLRHFDKLELPQALRETMNHYNLTGDRREWYKAAIGKMLSSRADPMHKGRVRKKHQTQPPPSVRVTLDKDGRQYSFTV